MIKHKLETQKSPNNRSQAVIRASMKYQDKSKVAKYVASVRNTQTDRREKQCIEKALAIVNLPADSSVLDVPCGAGRLFPILQKHKFIISGADVSASMIDEARLNFGSGCDLYVTDIFETGFPNHHFDLVICHRLFQYFSETADRRHVLSELSRIAKGPVIISFSCKLSLDYLYYRIKALLRIGRKRQCEPIGLVEFTNDIESVGFKVERWIVSRPLITNRWYAVLNVRQSEYAAWKRIVSPFKNICVSLLLRTAIVAAVILLLAYGLNS